MSRLQCYADFALRLEAANARPVAGTRIDNDERPSAFVDVDCIRRCDANESVIDGPRQLASVHDQVTLEFQDVRCGSRCMFLVARGALPEAVQEEPPTLAGIDPVVERLSSQIPWPADARSFGYVMEFRFHVPGSLATLRTTACRQLPMIERASSPSELRCQ